MRKRAYNRKERKTGSSVKREDSNGQRKSDLSIVASSCKFLQITPSFLANLPAYLAMKRHKHRILRFTLLCHGSVTASSCDGNNIMIVYSYNSAFYIAYYPRLSHSSSCNLKRSNRLSGYNVHLEVKSFVKERKEKEGMIPKQNKKRAIDLTRKLCWAGRCFRRKSLLQ